ncbi:hypothetical protein D9757_004336 [Collybiopsis confluens]|uniref:RhoGAP-domain-containing protein n=1 Tax=Collybiopsis confluens TaxID=2823264 RepID=A0A8H5HTQ3_9AGAR|nr:hypothetical protein D9757_004336 [Collybiopsis confluens]
MIAALGPPQHQQYPMPDDMEERLCPGCKLSVVSEEGGLVVAFGQCFFHVNCFKCAKCNDKVTADTNLLLLSDGSPICANCSYACSVCKQPILDEAIMTGDDAYHAHCFKCKVCKNRIDELVFAKTSQGIYCMDCHNDRMIKIRKHTQRKAERERERQAAQAAAYNELGIGGANKGGSISTSARDRERRGRELLGTETSSSHTLQSSRSTEFSTNGHPTPPPRAPYVTDAFEPRRSQSSVFHPPPRISSTDTPQRPPLAKNNSLPGALKENGYGAIPSLSVPAPNLNGSLNVTSIRDKRRSINPGLVIKPPVISTPLASLSPTSSPVQRSPPSANGTSDSPTSAQISSSHNETFPSSRPVSRSSHHSLGNVRTRTTSSISSASGAASVNGDDSTVTMRPLPSPLHTTSPFATSSPRPGSSSSLSKPDRFSGQSLSPRPGSSTRDRPPSRADVPHSVESATDDDDDDSREVEEIRSSRVAPSRSITDDSGRYPFIDAYGGGDVDTTSKNDQHHSTESAPPIPPPKETSTPAPLSTLPKRSSALATNANLAPITAISNPSSLTPDARSAFSIPSLETQFNEEYVPANGPSDRLTSSHDTGNSFSGKGDVSDSETSESSAEDKELLDAERRAEKVGEHTANRATATFIAPALPPIRFSLDAADFSDLFKSVGGNIKNLGILSENQEQKASDGDVPMTPPPSAASVQPHSMLHIQTVIEPLSAITDLPNLGHSYPNGSSTSLHASGSSTSLCATANAAMVVSSSADGSSANSEDGHASFSDHQPKKERSGLLRKVSFGKKNKLDRSASTSRTFKEKDRKTAAEALPTVPLPGSAVTSNGNERLLISAPINSEEALPPPITISSPVEGKGEAKESPSTVDLVLQRLQEVLTDASERGAQQLKLDRGFVEAIVDAMATRKAEYADARKQIDGMKRASKQYVDGISVAQTEFDRELKARRDAEAEVTRLRVLLSGQVAQLTALTGDSRRQELRQKISRELHENLNGLERDLSRLKVERDVTLAEVEELAAASSNSAGSDPPNLGRSLTKRLETLKSQYQRELLPLTQQREVLTREVMELKAARDVFLEETTVLNARNEELAQLGAQNFRRVAMAVPMVTSTSTTLDGLSKTSGAGPTIIETPVRMDSRAAQPPNFQQSHPHMGMYVSSEDAEARKMNRVEDLATPSRGPKVFKWGSRAKESTPILAPGMEKGKSGQLEHSFLPLSLLRFTRCDHCADKMWGSQLRCMGCNMSVHTRCVNQVHSTCSPQMQGGGNVDEPQILPPSMFGRDLIEQVRADSKGGPRQLPVIVEKCIEAVEALGISNGLSFGLTSHGSFPALEYEGIYRKTGGSGQSRIITQLFERGDYSAFDLRDSDRFNDICSVTSVLKTYLRSLPVPLLTHDLHDQFTSAVEIRDAALKHSRLTELVNELPSEHYHTARMLMLHLNRVCQRSEVNLMNARNLGVVFGRAEFSDMAGKALTIEWLIESAPQVFGKPTEH